MTAKKTDLTQDALSTCFKSNPFITDVHYFKAVGSTNATAFRLAHAGAGEGTLVVADAQTKGRGRLNRSWHSPPGVNVYASIILRPDIEAAVAPQITLMAGVAVAELFLQYGPRGVSLKWPNDVLIKGRKVCGILTEMKAAAERVDFIVLGMGLNINMRRQDFDPVLSDIATSLYMETGHVHDRRRLISGLFDLIEKWYRVFLLEGFPGLRERWLGYADIVGRPIRVADRDGFQTGIVSGIDDDGAILMLDSRGDVLKVIAGDIHLLER